VSFRLCSSISQNNVADALSRIGCLLLTMKVEVIGFDILKDTYSSYPDFHLIYSELLSGNHRSNVIFVFHDGY